MQSDTNTSSLSSLHLSLLQSQDFKNSIDIPSEFQIQQPMLKKFEKYEGNFNQQKVNRSFLRFREASREKQNLQQPKQDDLFSIGSNEKSISSSNQISPFFNINEEPLNPDSTNIGQSQESSENSADLVQASIFSTEQILAKSTLRYGMKAKVAITNNSMLPPMAPKKGLCTKLTQAKCSQILKPPLHTSMGSRTPNMSRKENVLKNISQTEGDQDTTRIGGSRVSSLNSYRITNRKWAHGSCSREVKGMLNQMTSGSLDTTANVSTRQSVQRHSRSQNLVAERMKTSSIDESIDHPQTPSIKLPEIQKAITPVTIKNQIEMMKMAKYQLVESRRRLGFSNVQIEENLYVKSGVIPQRHRVKSLLNPQNIINIQENPQLKNEISSQNRSKDTTASSSTRSIIMNLNKPNDNWKKVEHELLIKANRRKKVDSRILLSQRNNRSALSEYFSSRNV